MPALLPGLYETLPEWAKCEADAMEIGIVRHIYFWVCGIVFALLEGYDLWGKTQLSQSSQRELTSVLSQWSGCAFLVAIVIAAIQTYHRTRVELEDLQAPKLDLTFIEGQGHPYLRETPLKAGETTIGYERRYRVGVRNISATMARQTRVCLEQIEPGGGAYLPAPMQLMNADDHTEEFDVAPSGAVPSRYVDIVAHANIGNLPDHVRWEYAMGFVDRAQPVGEGIAIVLRAECATQALPCRRRFRLELRGGLLEFKPLGDSWYGDEAPS